MLTEDLQFLASDKDTGKSCVFDYPDRPNDSLPPEFPPVDPPNEYPYDPVDDWPFIPLNIRPIPGSDPHPTPPDPIPTHPHTHPRSLIFRLSVGPPSGIGTLSYGQVVITGIGPFGGPYTIGTSLGAFYTYYGGANITNCEAVTGIDVVFFGGGFTMLGSETDIVLEKLHQVFPLFTQFIIQVKIGHQATGMRSARYTIETFDGFVIVEESDPFHIGEEITRYSYVDGPINLTAIISTPATPVLVATFVYNVVSKVITQI